MPQAWIWRSGQNGGYDEIAFEQKIIVLPMHTIGDLTDEDRDGIRSLVAKAFPDSTATRRETRSAQLYSFRHTVAVGDLVVMLSNKVTTVAIGEVTGEYEFRSRPNLHVRPVLWLRDGVERVSVGADLLQAPASTALYRIQAPDAVARLRAVVEQGADSVRTALRGVPTQPSADDQTVRPFDRLQQNLDHARSLARAGEALQRAGTDLVDVTDVYRAAWVQGCAALDHWVRQEVTYRALALAASDSPPERLLVLGAPLVTAMQVAKGHRGVDDLLRDAITRFHGQKPYIQPDAVRLAFALVADTEDLWTTVAGHLRDDGIDSEYDAMTVPAAMSLIARRRNQIAHEYDEDPSSPDGKRPLTDVQVFAMLEWLERLAAAITAALPDDGLVGASEEAP